MEEKSNKKNSANRASEGCEECGSTISIYGAKALPVMRDRHCWGPDRRLFLA